jgi:ubiquinone biosynthesis protein UbiJ
MIAKARSGSPRYASDTEWRIKGAVQGTGQVESGPMPDPTPTPARRTANPVLAILGRTLEAALNRIVELDPQTRDQLGALDGRAITIDFRGALPSMRMTVDGDRLCIGPAFEGDSALHVAASPASFLSLALARGKEMTPGRIDISGDAELARRLERIATRFEPDFDEAFARVFGDVLGFQIARGVRRALDWSVNSARAFARDTAEFLTEEGRDLVAKPELEQFLDEVDALRERADRLESRLRRIASARAASAP